MTFGKLPILPSTTFLSHPLPSCAPSFPLSQPKSLMEERADRNLDSLDEDPTQVAALKDKTFVSKPSLEVNKVGGGS